MSHTKNFFSTVLSCLMLTQAAHGMTTKLYKADSSFDVPRLAKEGLTSFEILYSAGSTDKGINRHGKEVNILDLYGTEPLLVGLIGPESINNLGPNAIWTDFFGEASFTGTFHVNEMMMTGIRNLKNGFFLEFTGVIHDTRISDFDLQAIPNTAFAPGGVQQALEDLRTKLKTKEGIGGKNGYIRKYGLLHSYGFAGWSKHFENFEKIDFIDVTLKAGISFPELFDNFESEIISIPLDENYHFGFPLYANAAAGALDWLTVGAKFLGIGWVQTQKVMSLNPIKSDLSVLTPYKDWAHLKKKPFIHCGLYAIAEDIFKGLSLKVGYNYTLNQKTFIKPYNTKHFPTHIVNENSVLNGWEMSSIHFELEWNSATEEHPQTPTIKLYYTKPLKGLNVFKTPVWGAGYGLHFCYEF